MSFMTKLLGKIRFGGKNNSILFYFTITISLILLMASCSKPAGLIGVVVQPEDSKLKVGYTDTVTVRTYSRGEDTVRTDKLSTSQLGSNMDPVFGHTTAGLFVQFRLEDVGHSFGGQSAQVDSLVLYLAYANYYADTNTSQTIHAYEMGERIYVDSIYYSNIDMPIGIIDFANFEYTPRPHDTLFINGDSIPSIQRIDLMANTELAEYLIKAPAEDMDDNEEFYDYFKGLYLVTSQVSEGGAIISYNVLSPFSKMTLYYHNEDADSLSFDYTITTDCATANKYFHDHSTGNISFRLQVVEGDTLLGRQNIYVQGLGGVSSIIKFPFIKEWNKLGIVALNEAKLILSGSEDDPLWRAPQQLSMAEIQDDGSYGFLVDQVEETDLYFGGDYKSSTNSYTFRITRYLQSLLDNPDKKDNGLYLITSGTSLYSNRFVFDGYQPSIDTARRIKLELLYTNLD